MMICLIICTSVVLIALICGLFICDSNQPNILLMLQWYATHSVVRYERKKELLKIKREYELQDRVYNSDKPFLTV